MPLISLGHYFDFLDTWNVWPGLVRPSPGWQWPEQSWGGSVADAPAKEAGADSKGRLGVQ
jgi:hypothetical protein